MKEEQAGCMEWILESGCRDWTRSWATDDEFVRSELVLTLDPRLLILGCTKTPLHQVYDRERVSESLKAH